MSREVSGSPGEYPPGLDIGPMGPEDVSDVARLHVKWFAESGLPGTSLAQLGHAFIRDGFYRANLDNPYHAVDVARWEGRAVAFVAYVTDRKRVVGWTLRHHPFQLFWALLRAVSRRPRAIWSILLNLRYVGGERLSFVDPADAHCLLLTVEPECRSREFFKRTRIRLAQEMITVMERELVRRGYMSWYAGVAVANVPVNNFLERLGATHVGTGTAQGARLNYWRRSLA